MNFHNSVQTSDRACSEKLCYLVAFFWKCNNDMLSVAGNQAKIKMSTKQSNTKQSWILTK